MTIDTSALGFTWKKDEGVLEKLAPEGPAPKPTSPTTDRDVAAIRKDAIAALQQIADPEIPLNIWDLGLVYELTCEPAGFIDERRTVGAARFSLDLTEYLDGAELSLLSAQFRLVAQDARLT